MWETEGIRDEVGNGRDQGEESSFVKLENPKSKD